MMRRILFIAILFLAGMGCSYADSIPTAHMPEGYDYDKLMEYVSSDMPDEVDTCYVQHLLQHMDLKIARHDVRERLKADFLTEVINDCISEDPKRYIEMVDADITTDSLREKLSNAYSRIAKKYGAIWTGKPAPDFTFTDTKGKVHSLKDFRGKYLFIDFWGTWCIPCLEEIPYMEKLEKAYKDSRVKIISIACDKKRERWLNFLDKHKNMTWSQYLITPEGDNVLNNVYYVIGIPRFVLIAPDGKIINSDMLRPSDNDFNDCLERAIKE